ncbi:hypothetical protein M885DRAFT_507210 [Pelagophyceae sp. CCMP2097]|nr:hypothetical protein M885DRAFT_507210 [Pelagophyceae sp. CCMP2097]
MSATLKSGSMASGAQTKFLTTNMKEKHAERNGPRRIIFGLEPSRNNASSGGAKTESGGSYVGDWFADKKDGFGTQTWSNGNKYEGEWKSGKQFGKGSLWVLEGKRLKKRYAGDWVDGQRDGLGVCIFKNGDKYEGEWFENRRHGNGAMTYADGSHYEGGWLSGDRSGLGVLTLGGGDQYEGHWLRDKKEGPGRFFYKATAKVYQGEWVDGSPKCGTYRAASSDEVPGDAPHRFSLPQLRLKAPDAVVSHRVAEIRQHRASTAGADSSGFVLRVLDGGDLDALQEAFDSVDLQRLGLVPATAIGLMLDKCNMPVDDDAVERLLLELEADEDTRITFAEFADMAALLTS